MHIAESVLNRIMNAIEGDTPLGIISPMDAPTTPPDPAALGEAIEEGAEPTTVPDVSTDPAATPEATGILEQSLVGGSPFEGMVSRQFGDM